MERGTRDKKGIHFQISRLVLQAAHADKFKIRSEAPIIIKYRTNYTGLAEPPPRIS